MFQKIFYLFEYEHIDLGDVQFHECEHLIKCLINRVVLSDTLWGFGDMLDI